MVIAVALFAIIAQGGIVGMIIPLSSNRSASEVTRATQLAQEGLEAVRSIRDQNYANLVGGTKGIGVSSSLWAFVGTSDVTDKYTRVINIKNASRDAGGTLVTSGGTTDPDTFLVETDINWNYAVGNTKNVSLSTLLTNWRKSIGGGVFDGLIVYSRGTSIPPFTRIYTTASNSFGVATTLPVVVGSPRNFVIRTSPTKNEAVSGMLSTDGKLYVYCFDGTTWTQDWSVTIGVGTTRTKPFDIAYENTSGKAIVLYSTNVATTNELNFRVKTADVCGSANWGAATNFDPVRTSAAVSWVKLASNPVVGSNLIAATWVDWQKDLSSAIWNGTTFQNEPTAVGDTKVEAINTGISFPDVDAFDLAYESLSGDLMTIWGTSTGTNAINGVRYRLCTGNSASCTWGIGISPPTFADDATNLDLSANPNTDEMVFASIGNAGSDLQAGYWSGVGWTNTANIDTSSNQPSAGTKYVATGWLTSGSTKRSIITYSDSGSVNIGWYVGNNKTFTVQTDVGVTPVFASPQRWYEIVVNPKSKDQLMFTLSDNNSDLFAKRLTMNATPAFTWVASDGNTQVELNLGSNIVKPFGFAWSQK